MNYRVDRRRFQRLKVNLSVFYKIETPEIRNVTGEEEFEANSLDISTGGISFLSKYYIPSYTTLSVKFILFKAGVSGMVSFNDPIEIAGEVRSSVLTEESQFRLGICFKTMPTVNREEISDFINSASHLPQNC